MERPLELFITDPAVERNKQTLKLLKKLETLSTDSKQQIANIIKRVEKYQKFLEDEIKALDEDFKS